MNYHLFMNRIIYLIEYSDNLYIFVINKKSKFKIVVFLRKKNNIYFILLFKIPAIKIKMRSIHKKKHKKCIKKNIIKYN